MGDAEGQVPSLPAPSAPWVSDASMPPSRGRPDASLTRARPLAQTSVPSALPRVATPSRIFHRQLARGLFKHFSLMLLNVPLMLLE